MIICGTFQIDMLHKLDKVQVQWTCHMAESPDESMRLRSPNTCATANFALGSDWQCVGPWESHLTSAECVCVDAENSQNLPGSVYNMGSCDESS